VQRGQTTIQNFTLKLQPQQEGNDFSDKSGISGDRWFWGV